MIIKKIMLLIWNIARETVLFPVGILQYLTDLKKFVRKSKRGIPIKGIIPMVLDRYKSDGNMDRHYFLQDIYVAKKVIEKKPQKHFDIGSRVDGFVAHLLSALESDITIIDIRPLPITISNLNFIQADATNLEGIEDGSIESLSSLHAVEHFGLGRYGDAIDPSACFKAMKSLQRVVKQKGTLYFSVPIGKRDSVYFNSHRVFNPKTILKIFSDMELLEFSYIHDYKVMTLLGEEARTKIKSGSVAIENYDCGIFIFIKK